MYNILGHNEHQLDGRYFAESCFIPALKGYFFELGSLFENIKRLSWCVPKYIAIE